MAIDVGLKLQYEDLKKALEMAEQLDALLSNLGKGYNIKINQSGMNQTRRQFSSIEQAAVRTERAFRNAGEAVSSVGRGMQALGNAFGGKFIGTIKTMASAFATMGLYGAAQGTVQRYDTMRMFPKQMALLGFNADQSAKAVDKLEQSVIGLPTGLDEIVESARQLVTLTGDLEKGSNLAIAANNALLAGGGDAQQRTWGQRQIRDLLSAGRLRSQEWESLIKALGPGLKDIGEEMGYADYGKFRTELKANKIAAEDFLDALVKVGTGQGVLAQRADLYKDTLSATAKNIKNAIQKLGAAGLDRLGEVLKEKTGKDLPQTIVEISDAIKQKLVPALEGWISSNGDKIVAFFDKLKSYDWIGLVSKVGKGLAQYYNMVVGFFTKISPKVVAFLSVWAGPIGRLIQLAGSSIVGVGKVAATAIRIFGKTKPIEDAAKGVGAFTRFSGSLKHAFQGLGLAAGMTVEVAMIGGVIYEYAKIIESISNMKFGPNFYQNMSVIGEMGTWTTGIAGGLTALFSAITSSGLGLAVAGGELLTGGFLAIVQQIGNIIKAYAKTINYIAEMNVPNEGKIKSIGKTIVALNDNLLKKVKKVPNRKVTYLSRLTEMTDYVADIASSLKKVRGVGDVGDMSGIIGSIGKSLDAILDLDYDRQDKKRSKKISKTLKFLSDSTSSIADVASNLVSMKSNVSQLIKRGDATELNNVVSGFTNIATKTIDSLKGMQFGTGEVKTASANLKVVTDAVVSIGQIASTLVAAQGNIKKLINLDRTVSIGAEIQRVMYSLATALSTFEWEGDVYNRAKKNMDTFDKATASISKVFTSLVTVKENMNKVGLSDREDGMIGKITIILNRVKSVMDIIDSMDINTDGDAKEKMSAMAGMVKDLPAMVTSLSEAKAAVDGLGVGTDGTWDLGTKLKTIMNDLNAAFGVQEGQPNLLGEGGSLSGAAGNISAIAGALETIGKNGEAAGKGLDSAQKGLTDLGKAANDKKKAIDEVAKALGDLKTAVSGIAGRATLAAAGVAILGTSAKNNTSSIQNAATAASNLATAINNIPTNKTVNVQTNTGGGLSGALKKIKGAFGLAHGGVVRGPGGIDNVPRWLSSGEFVMTRRAHGAFGTSFMNSINNLDVDGAIRALSIRAGAGMRRGGMVTNNYSRDSHSNFTFNINRASQGFTQRRASKWARAFS